VETPEDLDMANVQSFGIQIDSLPEKSKVQKWQFNAKNEI
jgi:hypothetical protein